MTDQYDMRSTMQGWLDAFNQLDWERFTALLADDVTFTQVAQDRTDRGVADVRATFETWRGDWTDLHGEITQAFACADRGVLEVIWTGTLKHDGKRVRFPACLVFTLHAQKIVHVRDYYVEATPIE